MLPGAETPWVRGPVDLRCGLHYFHTRCILSLPRLIPRPESGPPASLFLTIPFKTQSFPVEATGSLIEVSLPHYSIHRPMSSPNPNTYSPTLACSWDSVHTFRWSHSGS